MTYDPKDLEIYDAFGQPVTYDDATAAPNDEGDDQPVTVSEVDGKRIIEGYAVVWGALSGIRRDGYRHQFRRGSIIWAPEVSGLWAHSWAMPLANTKNQTLTITEDDYGAKARIELDDTTDGNNAWTRVQNGLVDGMSFAGLRISATPVDANVLQITKFFAFEVSATINPSVPQTSLAVVDPKPVQKFSQAEKELELKKQKSQLERIALQLLKPRSP